MSWTTKPGEEQVLVTGFKSSAANVFFPSIFGSPILLSSESLHFLLSSLPPAPLLINKSSSGSLGVKRVDYNAAKTPASYYPYNKNINKTGMTEIDFNLSQSGNLPNLFSPSGSKPEVDNEMMQKFSVNLADS